MKFRTTIKISIFILSVLVSSGFFSNKALALDLPVVDDYNFTASQDFGGIYGSKTGEENPLTGGFSCPSGYTSRKIISAMPSFNSDVYYCYRAASVTGGPELHFRGMYITASNGKNSHENVFTGGLNCDIDVRPANFSRSNTFGGPASGTGFSPTYTMNYCYETASTVSVDDYDFGGFYSRQNCSGPEAGVSCNVGSNVVVTNPATGGASCPALYMHSYLNSSSTYLGSTSEFGIGICASLPMSKYASYNVSLGYTNDPPLDPPVKTNFTIEANPISIVANTSNFNLPVIFNSVEDQNRNGRVFIKSVKNSAGVNLLNNQGFFTSNSVNFSSMSEGQRVNVPITVSSTTPAGVYTAVLESRVPVMYRGFGQSITGDTSQHTRKNEYDNGVTSTTYGSITPSRYWYIPRIDDYITTESLWQVTSNGTVFSECAPNGAHESVNYIGTFARNVYDYEAHRGPGQPVPKELGTSNVFMKCPVDASTNLSTNYIYTDEQYKELLNVIAETTVNITVTNTVVPAPAYDYNLSADSNSIIEAGQNTDTDIIVDKTLGTARAARFYINKILNSSNVNTFNQTNGIGTTTGGFSRATVNANPSNFSILTLNTTANTTPDTYTVYPSTFTNLNMTSGFYAGGISGTCTGSHIASGRGVDGVLGSNVIECFVNGVRSLHSVLNDGFGVTSWNTTSASDANALFTQNANNICGAGNWTVSTGAVSFATSGTAESFNCINTLASPATTTVTLFRTAAYQVSVDPYGLVVADGPCIAPIDVSNNLTWKKVPAAANGYRVYRYQTGSPTQIATVSQPASGTTVTYNDGNINPSNNYYYYVVGIDSTNTPLVNSSRRSHISDDGCATAGSNSANVICTHLGTGLSASNRPQWQAEATEGNDPITFTWTNVVAGTKSKIGSYVENYVGTSPLNIGDLLAGPTVSIVDDNGNTDSAICPSVVYDPAEQLGLYVSGKVISDSRDGKKRYVVKKNGDAYSFVEFSGVNSGLCAPTVQLRNINDVGYVSGDPSILINGRLKTDTIGIYNLQLTCPKTSDGSSISSNAILEVVTPAIFEEF